MKPDKDAEFQFALPSMQPSIRLAISNSASPLSGAALCFVAQPAGRSRIACCVSRIEGRLRIEGRSLSPLPSARINEPSQWLRRRRGPSGHQHCCCCWRTHTMANNSLLTAANLVANRPLVGPAAECADYHFSFLSLSSNLNCFQLFLSLARALGWPPPLLPQLQLRLQLL